MKNLTVATLLLCLCSGCATLGLNVRNHTKTSKQTEVKTDTKADSLSSVISNLKQQIQQNKQIHMADNSIITQEDKYADTSVEVAGSENHFRVNLISDPQYLTKNRNSKLKIFDLKSNDLVLHCKLFKDDGLLLIDAVVNPKIVPIHIHDKKVTDQKGITNFITQQTNTKTDAQKETKQEVKKEISSQQKTDKKADVTTSAGLTAKLGMTGSWYIYLLIGIVIGIIIGRKTKK